MFTKENTHFQLWRIFCLLASLYSVAFYYFYQAPLFSVIFWVGQFLPVLPVKPRPSGRGYKGSCLVIKF